MWCNPCITHWCHYIRNTVDIVCCNRTNALGIRHAILIKLRSEVKECKKYNGMISNIKKNCLDVVNFFGDVQQLYYFFSWSIDLRQVWQSYLDIPLCSNGSVTQDGKPDRKPCHVCYALYHMYEVTNLKIIHNASGW